MSIFNPENSLLKVLMADTSAYWQVCEVICAEDFTPKGRKLFDAIAAEARDGRPCDSVTLAGKLGDDLGMYAYDIASHSPGQVGNALTYARMLSDEGEAKRVQQAGQRIAVCGSYSDAQALLAQVRPMQTQKLKSMNDGLQEMTDTLQRRYDAAGDITGITTGIASLDAITGGWQPGNLVVLAARPGMGKTAFALQAAMAAGRTLFFSLEMTAGELMERAAANIGNFPNRWLRFPKDAPEHALTRVLEASRILQTLPLQLDDSASVRVEGICSRTLQAHMAEPVNLIIVDHLGLIGRDYKNDASELGAITSQLKRLAKETGATVLLLCQLNRSLESRADRRPVMSDVRDSGRIEEDADLVIALYRDDYYDESSPHAGYMEIILRKHRSGERVTVWAKANLGCMRLESCDEPERSVAPSANDGGNRTFKARFGARREPHAVSVAGRYD
ncbi:MAG: AAA family ATPase [Pseudomonadota bacterium]|nr:AAA family ATPase [Pseudomonadota bacterium]